MASAEIEGNLYTWWADFELKQDAESVKAGLEKQGFIAVISDPLESIESQKEDGNPLCSFGLYVRPR